jgi:hypothetical protein
MAATVPDPQAAPTMTLDVESTITMPPPPASHPDIDVRYASLNAVLNRAFEQAARGKGMERHAAPGERFEDQQIVRLGSWMGSTHFQIGQAVKKALESTRMPTARAVPELLGAIVYLAAAVVQRELETKGSDR